ncbi:MAG: NLP/P60 [uncultured bacterium]|nr:MAG: NLP/P60 [uncultured bacterium]
MIYHTIHLPVVDMKKTPQESGEIVSQTYFSEHVLIKKHLKDWVEIITTDGYAGWIPASSLLNREVPYISKDKVTNIHARLYDKPDAEESPLILLPYGARLQVVETIDERWFKVLLPDGKQVFVQRGDLAKEPKGLLTFSKQFLGIPYVWGGRSSFGYDCSGFVQMLYQWAGMHLPRDSHMQCADKRGRKAVLEELGLGDLIFWGTSDGVIKHVGMYLEKDSFIHTSSREGKPFLRISQLSDAEWNGNKENRFPTREYRRFF